MRFLNVLCLVLCLLSIPSPAHASWKTQAAGAATAVASFVIYQGFLPLAAMAGFYCPCSGQWKACPQKALQQIVALSMLAVVVIGTTLWSRMNH